MPEDRVHHSEFAIQELTTHICVIAGKQVTRRNKIDDSYGIRIEAEVELICANCRCPFDTDCDVESLARLDFMIRVTGHLEHRFSVSGRRHGALERREYRHFFPDLTNQACLVSRGHILVSTVDHAILVDIGERVVVRIAQRLEERSVDRADILWADEVIRHRRA